MGVPSYNEIVGLIKTGLTIEAQEKIMELRGAALELQEENFSLKEKVRQMEATISQAKSLLFRKDRYFLQRNGGPDDGPFCVRCYDSDGKLIRLLEGFGSNDRRYMICTVCGNEFPLNQT